jgi:hypothetical protein
MIDRRSLLSLAAAAFAFGTQKAGAQPNETFTSLGRHLVEESVNNPNRLNLDIELPGRSREDSEDLLSDQGPVSKIIQALNNRGLSAVSGHAGRIMWVRNRDIEQEPTAMQNGSRRLAVVGNMEYLDTDGLTHRLRQASLMPLLNRSPSPRDLENGARSMGIREERVISVSIEKPSDMTAMQAARHISEVYRSLQEGQPQPRMTPTPAPSTP